MFTGIIASCGSISSLDDVHTGRKIIVYSPGFFKESISGDSVSNNGICLTIIDNDSDSASFFVQEETMNVTTSGMWDVGDSINLEHPLTLNALVGGHLVQGHIDGVGSILEIVNRDDGSQQLSIEIPSELQRYVVTKGSIAINGVSLTVAQKTSQGCNIALIPATIEQTTFARAKVGDRVNIEVDYLARYIEQFLQYQNSKDK